MRWPGPALQNRAEGWVTWWRGAAVGAPSNRSAQLVALVLAEAARAGYRCMQGLEGAFHLP